MFNFLVNKYKSISFLIISICILISVQSCKISYSFTGASISPDVKTISIQNIPNQAELVVPSLSQTCTEGLKDKFLSQTSLQLVNGTGDLNIEGEITDYRVKPMAIQSTATTDVASLNRLTITIMIRFSNAKDPKQNYSQSFSRFSDYASSQSLDAIEETLIKEILDQINEDIFNKALANW